MTGNISGGKKSAQTIYKRHGKDFYKKMGRLGGQKSRGGGFGDERVGRDGLTGAQRAKLAGRKGGGISRRGKKTKDER